MRENEVHLKFVQPHLSIRDFPEIDIPQLTVIVGLNGSGKSHLLQAIANGSVSNSVVQISPGQQPSPNSPVRLLMPGEPAPDLGGSYTPPAPDHRVQSAPDNAAVFLQIRKTELEGFWREIVEITAGKIEVYYNSENIWKYTPSEIVDRLSVDNLLGKIANIFERAGAHLSRERAEDLGRRRGGPLPSERSAFAHAKNISRSFEIPIYALDEHSIKMPDQWGPIDPFSVNLAMILGRYRDRQLKNWLVQKSDLTNRRSRAFSDDEFSKKFGPPPWDLITSMLMEIGIPYEINPPDGSEYTSVTVEFKKIDDGSIVKFSNLSSGEKILVLFALSIFQYDKNFVSINRPTILLLDEMDSSLHPEMVARWLGAIQRELVGQQGMHCILATHSPITAAMAPEESLYEMVDGQSGLSKISKQNAMRKMTYGVPTLSVDCSRRRQIFVESNTDVTIYENVYAIIKDNIKCDYELNFITSGLRGKDRTEINAGCEAVKRIVGDLSEKGVPSVFGIIDWDGKATSTDRIKVLAQGERNGIENVLLDPLLVGLLLMKERYLPKCFGDIDRFAGAQDLSEANLQRLVNYIQNSLFPGEDDKTNVRYFGGKQAFVLQKYLEFDDHELEKLLYEKFPQLNSLTRRNKNNHTGALINNIVNHVLREHWYYCPGSLCDIFKSIGNAAEDPIND